MSLELNDAFDLREMQGGCVLRGATEAKVECDRRAIQMERYQTHATFGILENKLIIKPLLAALGLPTIRPAHSVLLVKQAKAWQEDKGLQLLLQRLQVALGLNESYSRTSWLKAAASLTPARTFVLKPITNGGSNAVLLMNQSEWLRRNYTDDQIANAVESILFGDDRAALTYAQKYEIPGAMLEPRYDFLRNGSALSGLREMKAIVVFGVPEVVHTQPLPRRRRSEWCFFHRSQATGAFGMPSSSHRTHASPICRKDLDLLNRMQPQLEGWARRVAALFGADWYRLDVLTGNEELGWRINEVTYPSGWPDTAPKVLRDAQALLRKAHDTPGLRSLLTNRAWERLRSGYRAREQEAGSAGRRVVPEMQVLEQLTSTIERARRVASGSDQ